ncbi:MAG: hypothetical protein QOK07_740 [Gemmatimonadaceae bacterium]|jgi:hypothetical protein|nr:hypothetical protein [Gemmatimonadaceae bacterium]
MNKSYRFHHRLGKAVAITALAFTILSASSSLVAQTPPPFGPAVTAGRSLRTTDMTNATPLIPGDIYRNVNPSTQDLATFAWLEFISAVSPANGQQRGTPGGSFAQSGSYQAATLLWETYQHRSELLPFNSGKPVPPQPWNSTPKYVESYTNSKNVVKTYALALPNYNNLDEATQIGQNILYFPVTPGKPNPQSDAQVLFEAKVNQYSWGFVNANYSKLIPIQKPFRFSPPISLPTGTVEVKAAWRPLSSIPPSQRYRYHVATVIIHTGSDTAPVPQTAKYALIGLHIIHKSPNYPAFTFATFEQVDDLQNQATGKPSGVYYVPGYNSINYTTSATTTFPPSGTTVNNPTINFNNIKFNTKAPTANPNGNPTRLPLGGVGAAIPVTQPVATLPGVARANEQALAAMSHIPGFNSTFVWQYYKLAGVQAIPTNNDSAGDFYLANIVVESSQPGIQLFRGFPNISGSPSINPTTFILTNARNQVNVIDSYGGHNTMTSSGGCQGCHGVAQTQNGFDFSFLFFGANGGGFSPETTAVPPPATALARVVRRKAFLK